jgi:hypothetical protein
VSKEAWFREYERLYNEREDCDGPETDQELAERAHEAVVDRQADLVDYYRDLRKDGELR